MYSLSQASKKLGITPDSLRQRIARKTLKAKKIGEFLWVISDLTMKKLLIEKKKL